MTESDALLVLNAISGLGNVRIKKIIDRLGSAADVFRLKDSERIVPAQILKNIQDFPKDKYLKKEYNLVQFHHVQLLTYKDADFPQLLKEIPDSPLVLYVKGNIKALNTPSLAMVGSRRASVYGLSMAEKFSGELAAAGVTIVSGLARGIDAACHRAALKVQGTTVAVLGCGMCHVFPPENKGLAEEIGLSGALVSEFSMETFARPYYFPKRNRIISGLSLGVVVVEASDKSGALITSDFALEQGREVFAIPGKIDQPNAQGVNRLIKEGAKLASSVEDILEELKLPLSGYIKNLSFPNVPPGRDPAKAVTLIGNPQQIYLGTGPDKAMTGPPITPILAFARKHGGGGDKLHLSQDEKPIYQQLSDEPVHIDDLAAQCEIPVSELMAVLLKFELDGIIKQLPGKLFVRT